MWSPTSCARPAQLSTSARTEGRSWARADGSRTSAGSLCTRLRCTRFSRAVACSPVPTSVSRSNWTGPLVHAWLCTGSGSSTSVALTSASTFTARTWPSGGPSPIRPAPKAQNRHRGEPRQWWLRCTDPGDDAASRGVYRPLPAAPQAAASGAGAGRHRRHGLSRAGSGSSRHWSTPRSREHLEYAKGAFTARAWVSGEEVTNRG